MLNAKVGCSKAAENVSFFGALIVLNDRADCSKAADIVSFLLL